MQVTFVPAALGVWLILLPPGSVGAAPAADTVVAVVGGKNVTYGAILKKAGTQLAQMQAKYLIDRRNLESEALREIIEGELIEAEAKARGIEPKELLAEIDKKVPEPTEEEIKRMYERAKLQIDLPFEVLKPRIVEALRARSKEAARRTYLDGLRAKAGVKVTLPPPDLPVVEVAEAGNPARGPANAPVKVVVFSDFECPYCARVVPTLHELYGKYPGKIRMVFRDFPLDMHESARKAGEAAHCANDQGKFWEYHDRLFAHQDRLKERDLVEHAKELKLDTGAFEKCLQSGRYKEDVERDRQEGERLGVTGTPAVFINGVLLSGALPLNRFTDVVDAFLSRTPPSTK